MKKQVNLTSILCLLIFLSTNPPKLNAQSNYILTPFNLNTIIDDIMYHYGDSLLIGEDSLRGYFNHLLKTPINPSLPRPNAVVEYAKDQRIIFKWAGSTHMSPVRFSYLGFFEGNVDDKTLFTNGITLDPFNFKYHLFAFSRHPNPSIQSAIEIVIVDLNALFQKTPQSIDRQQAATISHQQSPTVYPNPFLGSTTLEYQLADAGPVHIEICNDAGCRALLPLVWQSPGTYQFQLGSDLPAGTTICIVQIRDRSYPIQLLKTGD